MPKHFNFIFITYLLNTSIAFSTVEELENNYVRDILSLFLHQLTRLIQYSV